MELGLTFPLQRFLKRKPPPYGAEPDRRFCWDLHVITLRGNPCLLAVHCHSRYAFVRYDVTPLQWADLPALFREGLLDSLTAAGFSGEQVEDYLRRAGTMDVTRTHGRREVAFLNRAWEDVLASDLCLDTDRQAQPLLDQLRQTGLTCILVEMPFHLAIFDVNAAGDVMVQFPDIQHWYIAGHSMGGAMASQFASEYPDEVDGLLLLGAYLYGDYPPADTLTVYGSLNQSVEDKIDYTENVVEIEGGNHAQFGNYGPQKGDLPATISAEEQQAQTVEAISDFIAQRQK